MQNLLTKYSFKDKQIYNIEDQPSTQDSVALQILNTSDILNIIIPFFVKYPILGIKALDFADFCKVAELMKTKAHLTLDGLEEIRLIKEGMNKGRK